MDIRIEPNRRPLLRRYWPVLPALGVVVALVVANRSFGSATYVAEGDELAFGAVQRGEFAVQVRGAGTLVPKHVQWLATNVDGRVDGIAVEAGSAVEAGDAIVTLANPKLEVELREAQWELEAVTKENRAAEAALRSQLADLRAVARNAELDHESAKLKLEAERQLVERGIVSRLTFGQSRLAVQQHEERIASARERVTMMEANLAALVDAHAARENKLRNSLNLIRRQVDDLTVRARIDGVVQEIAPKLGQRLVQGAEVARIAPHDNLVALLDVQDFQAPDVALGQAVTVDTRTSRVAGKVVRIDPAVTNGVVKVEVAFDGPMPPEARPDASVEGVIDVARKRDALFVERPSFAQSGRRLALYRVDDDGDAATRVAVELGRASTRHIEVLGGLREGDRIIVSDPSAWERHDHILIR
jgi:multidrug efflux pump subunit AcrA (membrane-fusion protein)